MQVIERSFIMGLLERVSTLIRANINDLVDRAEDPEKLIKQVILDMENQYLQVKPRWRFLSPTSTCSTKNFMKTKTRRATGCAKPKSPWTSCRTTWPAPRSTAFRPRSGSRKAFANRWTTRKLRSRPSK